MAWDRLPPVVRIIGQEILVVGTAVFCVLLSHPSGIPHAQLAALIASLALPLRLRWPWLAMLIALVALSGELGLAPAAFALYRIGRTSRSFLGLLGWAAAAVLAPQITILITQHLNWQDATLSIMFSLAWTTAPLSAGVLVRTRQSLKHSLSDLHKAREAELTARTNQARAEERSRIGQEIHDSVGHHATLIAVEAAALAATVLDVESKKTAHRIREQAKASLAEMRAALGLTATPAPDPADVSALITRMQNLGMHLDYTDEAPDLTPPLKRAVYRIVQESLTNATKHAPGAAVTVKITNEGPNCLVTVTSGPNPTPTLATTWPTSGLGLTGMLERAKTVGGDLKADQDPDGTFTVKARLPLPPSKVGSGQPTIGGVDTGQNAR